MTRVRAWLSILGASLGLLFLAAPLGAENKDQVPALELQQTHSFTGDFDVILSKAGMRMHNKGRMGFTLVAAEPDWQVTVFRDDDKTYMRNSLPEFQKTGMWSDMIITCYDRDWKTTLTPSTFKFFQWTAKRIVHKGRVFEYLPLDGIAAPEVEKILYVAFKTPTNGGIPLHYRKTVNGNDWMTGMKENGEKRVILSTSDAKAITVSRKIFQPPSGYQAATAMQNVLHSKASRGSCDDFGDIFDMGANKDRKKSTTARPH